MQPTHRSSRILLPVRLWFVVASFIVALILDFIPVGRFSYFPDWTALVLAFWCVREPQLVGVGTGFVLGLAMDIGQGAALGQHALAFVLLAHFAAAMSRRLLWFSSLTQALHVLPLLLLAQAVMMLVRLSAGGEFPGWTYFASSVTGALAWAPLSLLLLLPQYQPVDRDDNRPI